MDIVVKFGTTSLLEEGKISQSVINDFARQIAKATKKDHRFVIVSSGCIKAGKEILEESGVNVQKSGLDKKGLSSFGVRQWLNFWNNAFQKQGEIGVSPCLITYANWKNLVELKNIKSSIISDWRAGIITLINENDRVATDEIKDLEKGIGENDTLARMVADLINADAVLFLTDEGGVFEENPKQNPKARQYKEIDIRDMKKLNIGERRKNSEGKGGIEKKLEAAVLCAKQGMLVCIASGKEQNVITNFCKKETVGTKIGNKNIFY